MTFLLVLLCSLTMVSVIMPAPVPSVSNNCENVGGLNDCATYLPIEEKELKDQTKEISPAVAPKVTKKNKYAIQIRAFPQARKKDAVEFAKDLRRTLPDVYVERVNIRKRGVWYRILTGDFTCIEDATDYMKEKKILEANPGSFVQLKSEGQSSKPKPEAFAHTSFKVAWKEGIILGLLMPPNTTKEQLKAFIYKIRQGKKDKTLSKFLPPVNLKFTDKYTTFIIFIFSDQKWATHEAYMKYEKSDMKSKVAKTYLNHIAASYLYDLDDKEYGSLGYDDGSIKSVHYKKLF